MVGYDSFKQLEDIFDNEAIKKISPKFSEQSLDLREITKYSKDPMFMAMLLFKLVEEREKTNKLLAEIYDKFDAIMFKMKTSEKQKICNTCKKPRVLISFWDGEKKVHEYYVCDCKNK